MRLALLYRAIEHPFGISKTYLCYKKDPNPKTPDFSGVFA